MMEMKTQIRDTYKNLIEDYFKGNIHCGKNGPYDDQETKVRNLCNLIIASCAMVLEQDTTVCDAQRIESMVEELDNYEDEEGLYIIREKKGKDSCNGVLGHAWVIEAYLYAYLVTKKEEYVNRSLRIFSAHRFDSNIGLWRCPDKFGGKIDMTINHQIWYAGVVAELYMITKDSKVKAELAGFEKKFWKNTRIHLDGLFCHYVQPQKGILKMKNYVKNIIDSTRATLGRPSMKYKEIGYHMFCIAGLARLKLVGVCENIYNDRKFLNALEYCNKSKYINGLENNKHSLDVSTLTNKKNVESIKCNIYGYSYNAPGFEVEFVESIFGGINDETIKILENKQIEFNYDERKRMFSNNTMDAFDLSYKVYEAMIKKEHWKAGMKG